MARSRGSFATVEWVSVEPLGFVPMPVTFHITGAVSPYYPATRDGPPEGGEVEITEVIRIDPFTKEETDITGEDWPFSDKEQEEIEGLIADRASENYEPDYDDSDDYEY